MTRFAHPFLALFAAFVDICKGKATTIRLLRRLKPWTSRSPELHTHISTEILFRALTSDSLKCARSATEEYIEVMLNLEWDDLESESPDTVLGALGSVRFMGEWGQQFDECGWPEAMIDLLVLLEKRFGLEDIEVPREPDDTRATQVEQIADRAISSFQAAQ